jgi:hypothetical protein
MALPPVAHCDSDVTSDEGASLSSNAGASVGSAGTPPFTPERHSCRRRECSSHGEAALSIRHGRRHCTDAKATELLRVEDTFSVTDPRVDPVRARVGLTVMPAVHELLDGAARVTDQLLLVLVESVLEAVTTSCSCIVPAPGPASVADA